MSEIRGSEPAARTADSPEADPADGEPVAAVPSTIDPPVTWSLTRRVTLALLPGLWAAGAVAVTVMLALGAVDGWLHHGGRVPLHGDTSLPAGLMLVAVVLPASLAAFVGWATALILRATARRRAWTGLLIFSVSSAVVWLVVWGASFLTAGGQVIWLALMPGVFIYLAALATIRLAAIAAPPAAAPPAAPPAV